jgi:hypothetical protein
MSPSRFTEQRQASAGMHLSDDDVQQFAEADRREVDPPIQVERATRSKAGQLDWWGCLILPVDPAVWHTALCRLSGKITYSRLDLTSAPRSQPRTPGILTPAGCR